MTRAPTTAAGVAAQRRMVAAPSRLGVTPMQRQAFRKRLFNRMFPLMRSGRMNRNLLEGYRTELRSAALPAWIASDVRIVLDELTGIIEQPAYQEDASLAGDLGDYSGIIDWATGAATDIWGGIKQFGTETVIPKLSDIVLRKPDQPTGPATLPAYKPPEVPVTTLPAVTEPARTLLPVEAPTKGLPWWGYALLAGGAFMLFRK